jgi:hypothetical protein
MTREHPAGSRVIRQAGKPAATNAAPRPSQVAPVSEFGLTSCILTLSLVGRRCRAASGRLARKPRLTGRSAGRNSRESPCIMTVSIGSNRCARSVRRVAGRHRRVACATRKRFFRQALGSRSNEAQNPSAIWHWFKASSRGSDPFNGRLRIRMNHGIGGN